MAETLGTTSRYEGFGFFQGPARIFELSRKNYGTESAVLVDDGTKILQILDLSDKDLTSLLPFARQALQLSLSSGQIGSLKIPQNIMTYVQSITQVSNKVSNEPEGLLGCNADDILASDVPKLTRRLTLSPRQ